MATLKRMTASDTPQTAAQGFAQLEKNRLQYPQEILTQLNRQLTAKVTEELERSRCDVAGLQVQLSQDPRTARCSLRFDSPDEYARLLLGSMNGDRLMSYLRGAPSFRLVYPPAGDSTRVEYNAHSLTDIVRGVNSWLRGAKIDDTALAVTDLARTGRLA